MAIMWMLLFLLSCRGMISVAVSRRLAFSQAAITRLSSGEARLTVSRMKTQMVQVVMDRWLVLMVPLVLR
jgi:hypothetical protein